MPRLLAVSLCFAVFVCCGSPKKKPVVTAAPPVKSRHKAVNPLVHDTGEQDPGMAVSGLMGTLDPGDVQEALTEATAALGRCFRRQSSRRPYLGGKLVAKFRVKRDGTVKQVWLSESTVGSRAIELCALRGFEQTRFPRPAGGGPADVSYAVNLPSRVGVKSLDATRVRKSLDLIAKTFKERPQGLTLVLYVGRGGTLVSFGMSAEEPIDEDFERNLASSLAALRFDRTISSVSKVIFPW